jgi:hypothetical protein
LWAWLGATLPLTKKLRSFSVTMSPGIPLTFLPNGLGLLAEMPFEQRRGGRIEQDDVAALRQRAAIEPDRPVAAGSGWR